MKTVREFSRCGPCLPLGELRKETSSFFVYQDRRGETRRIGKRRGLVHIEPCPSCMDHPRTQYPDGYMD